MSEPQSDTCDYQSGGGWDEDYDSIKHLVIRATDIFKFDETTLKTCEAAGDHGNRARQRGLRHQSRQDLPTLQRAHREERGMQQGQEYSSNNLICLYI